MKTLELLILAALWACLCSSCATIAGGSKYNAHVVVSNNSQATIKYEGVQRGTGAATFKVKRNQADKFVFTVSQQGCEEQPYSYTSRTFRGGALVGTLVTWTGVFGNGLVIPWGLFVDLATGALWNPTSVRKV